MRVFVVDKNHKPLMPCSPKRARHLLTRKRARIHKMYPFTIRMVDLKQADCLLQPVTLKIDPGSKTTGLALVRTDNKIHHVLHTSELHHRGDAISENLSSRSGHRRIRRSRLRYRQPRFDNRSKPAGWLPPSLQHRVDTVLSWANRFKKLVPLTDIALELVRFDTQLMQNKNISGVLYQQGTLWGTEVKEYLLAKWNRTCAYCDAKNTIFEVEHIAPKSKGGSDRVSNLTLACVPCNQKKGSMSVTQFVTDKKRLFKILSQRKKPLRDAAAVNSTRNALYRGLLRLGLPVETATGGLTKWNRTCFNVPKTHALDAACVGECDDVVSWTKQVFGIKATGRGSYQRTRLNKHGIRRGDFLLRQKRFFGFATGDMVKAVVTTGKKIGVYVGRVAVRKTGSFNINTGDKPVQGIGYRNCKLIQRGDGYGYF